MTNQQYNDWTAWTGPLQDLAEVNKKAATSIANEISSYCTDLAGAGFKVMQTLPRITSPEDFVKLQVKFFTEQGENFLQHSENMMRIYQDAVKEHFNAAESNVATALKTASIKTKREAA